MKHLAQITLDFLKQAIKGPENPNKPQCLEPHKPVVFTSVPKKVQPKGLLEKDMPIHRLSVPED